MAKTPRWAKEEAVRAVLAFAGVPGIILALLALWWGTGDPARVDALSRFLSGAMLLVLGFYFGRADVSRAHREADEARADAERLEKEALAITSAAGHANERAALVEKVLYVMESDPELRARIEELIQKMEEG